MSITMAKYTPKTVERIAELVRSDSYTINEICAKTGIDVATFHRWKSQKKEFCDMLEEKRAEFNEMVVVEARRSLMKKIKGYTAVESKTVTTPSAIAGEAAKIKEHTHIEKHVAPDTVAIIFLLTNKAPDEYRNRQSVEAKVDTTAKLGELSDLQLNEVIQAVLNKNSDGK